MPWKVEEREGVVIRQSADRVVLIPSDFVLVGDAITIRQEKDGAITIFPASEEGVRALERFNPFEEDDDHVRQS